MIRILLNLSILLSVFIFPIYISICLIFLAIFIAENFVEALFWGFLLDMFYGGGGILGIHFVLFSLTVVFIFYMLSFKLKEMLRLSF